MTTVLVVEDDLFLRDIFQRVLERAGFHVLTAAHGKEALASFHGGGVGVVVTDLMMPEFDGFQLIRALKREAPGVPVIAVSVMNDIPNCRDEVVALGAEMAICKPVNPRDLVKFVRQFTLSPNASTSLQ
jgi:DNA-binding response OmpR family regulator